MPVNSQPQNTRIFPRTPHNYPPPYALVPPITPYYGRVIPFRYESFGRSGAPQGPRPPFLFSLFLSFSLPLLCLNSAFPSGSLFSFLSFLTLSSKCSTRDYIPFYILYSPPSSFLLFLFVYSLCSCACSYNPRILFHLAHHPTTFPPFPPCSCCDLAPLSLSLSFRPLTDTPLKSTEYLTTIIVISTVSKRTED